MDAKEDPIEFLKEIIEKIKPNQPIEAISHLILALESKTEKPQKNSFKLFCLFPK